MVDFEVSMRCIFDLLLMEILEMMDIIEVYLIFTEINDFQLKSFQRQKQARARFILYIVFVL
jgi:hypothetical protein